MKKLLFITVVIILGFSSCSKEFVGFDDATITTADMRMCMCCGGFIIEIGDSTFRFSELPRSSRLDLSQENLPMDVEVKWRKLDDGCLGDEIELRAIRKK